MRHETVYRHLLRVSRALAGQLDFQSAIHAVSHELHEILPHDHLDICIIRRDMHVAYEAGLHTDWGLTPTPHPVIGSPIRDLLNGLEPFLISDDAINDPRFSFDGAFSHPIHDQNLRSRLHVPLIVHGEIIGALSCSSHATGFYRRTDIPLAQHLADTLAPYLYALRAAEDLRRSAIDEAAGRAREEGLREGALRLTEELEQERQRIGMDLHDQTLADLTRIERRIARLAQAPGGASGELAAVGQGLQRCMAELREIIDDARPNVLELFGFADGVEDFLNRALADGGGIAHGLTDDSAGAFDRLAPTLRLALFRIVQEAVNNAARHAEPSTILVELAAGRDAAGGRLTIIVSDDGIGFDTAVRRKRLGGLRNMQTRARLVSAALDIDRREDGPGTRVRLSLSAPLGGQG
ncbi:GAF domain-containing sensor histidine kinase [Aureimonas frigidaquae]|uniref:GAF domain-containing sensor histidine kinase n=1 Tax=Aureimonas frigidaquae TaxID=424757 RepID=UPI0009FA872C|nr:GAF domain-containing protein [Aureimonas frigidaquae]